MEVKDWVKAARAKAGWSLEKLGEQLGRSKANIGHWETGKHKPSYQQMLDISRLTGYLMPDQGEHGHGQAGEIEGNTSPIEARRRVPLISWVRAGELEDVRDPFYPGEADEWEDVYTTRPGDNAFALRVDGDSMTSPYPGELSFPDGTIIIVDPGRSANAGDFVVAKDVSTQRATFKKLTTDAGRWFLKPLNPAYPTVEIDDPALRVIGRVIEYRRGGKL